MAKAEMMFTPRLAYGKKKKKKGIAASLGLYKLPIFLSYFQSFKLGKIKPLEKY